MKILKEGDRRVARIINKKTLGEDALYRISSLSYRYSRGGRYLIRNTLSFEVTELTEQENTALSQLDDAPVTLDFIRDNGLEQLARSRCIVETDYDEAGKYRQVIFLLKTMAGRKEGITSYTILPTTACNARCTYCYEEGIAVRSMSPDTADRLVDYICENRAGHKVSLHWFGGEPTAAAHIITRICTALSEREVPFASDMITNASLITRALAREAKEVWHLRRVQVSLDGYRTDYELRKRYLDPAGHNYDAAMRAVHYLADEGIKVDMRVNIDTENLPRIEAFLHDIKAEFPDTSNISLYLALLFQAQHSADCIPLYRELFRLSDIQKQLGIPQNFASDHKSVRIRTNYCMADSDGKSVVIAPDGSFNNCEHLPEGRSWGNIFFGVTDPALYERLFAPVLPDEQCEKCPFLPECTPFYKKGCPGWFEQCREYHSLRLESILGRLLEGTDSERLSEPEEQ